MNLFDNNTGAEFSKCIKYRYKLWRIWDRSLPIAMIIGLNPSTANAETNDPTINNIIRILKQNDYGGFYMMNCFPLISSKPEVLLDFIDDEFYEVQMNVNDEILLATAQECRDVIFAWGGFKIVPQIRRDKQLFKMFPNAKCFDRNRDGSPCHAQGFAYKGKIHLVKILPYK